jgi:hypothetical protein
MYFVTPRFSVAINPKVASSSLARAITRDFWPEVDAKIQSAAYPDGKGPDTFPPHALCPRETEPSKPVVVVCREPVSRFASAMAQFGLGDVDSVLEALELKLEYLLPRGSVVLADDGHFRPQSLLVRQSAQVFRLEDIESAAKYIGLVLPLPVINEASRPKPQLTAAQVERVMAFYAADKLMYDATASGGVAYEKAATPSPVPSSVTATQIRLWLVRNGVPMTSVSRAVASISDQQSRAEAEVLWEYAPYIERSHPMLEPLGAALGLSSAQIDKAFIEAAQL